MYLSDNIVLFMFYNIILSPKESWTSPLTIKASTKDSTVFANKSHPADPNLKKIPTKLSKDLPSSKSKIFGKLMQSNPPKERLVSQRGSG